MRAGHVEGSEARATGRSSLPGRAEDEVGIGLDFIFSGDLFDHKGGTKLGRLAGHCASTSASPAGAKEVLCSTGFVLEGGQTFPVTGGTSAATPA